MDKNLKSEVKEQSRKCGLVFLQSGLLMSALQDYRKRVQDGDLTGDDFREFSEIYLQSAIEGLQEISKLNGKITDLKSAKQVLDEISERNL